MNAYKVADTYIKIDCNNNYLVNRMKVFQCKEKKEPDISIDIKNCSAIEKPEGIAYIEDSVKWLKKAEKNGGFHIYRMDDSEKHILSHIDIDNYWSKGSIKCLQHEITDSIPKDLKDLADLNSFILMGLIFRNYLLHNNGIVIHASSIAWNGKGILFTAPSGTGKSTHVRLWEKYLGDEVTVINDDTPAIRFKDDVPMLCGTPWSGSSDKFSNLSVPLGAMVVLEQAPENRIRKLSPIEALPRIMPRTFLPFFDKEMMEKAYVIIEKLISRVPIYDLGCRPDREAMEIVYQCVKSNG